jgi:hypothetical protein
VNHGRGALCSSDAETRVGFALTSIVAVSVQFALTAKRISLLGSSSESRREAYSSKKNEGHCTTVVMNSRWLSDDTLSEWSGTRLCCGGYASQQVKDDNAHLRKETGVHSHLMSQEGGPSVRRRVVLLSYSVTSCGLEILARTLESLSLRVPVRNSLVSKNEKPLFAVRPEKHIIVQKKRGGSEPFL